MPRDRSDHEPGLGDRLRALRESKEWSLREVAAKAGVNHGYLSQLERGEVSEPAPSMLHKLAEGYGEPFVVLMRWANYVEDDDSGLTENQSRALSYLGDDISDDELHAIKAVLDAIRTRRATFAQYAGSFDGELDPTERHEIRQHVLKVLEKADALGVVPTPLEQVMEISQLVATGEVTLDAEERRQLRKRFGSLVDLVLKKLRGAIHFRAREVWVSPHLHVLKKRFVTAHEIGHDVLPWQRDVIAYLDDEERLSHDVRISYERQANQAAIELLAQGDTLRKEADDSRLTLDLLSDLRNKYQISLQAISRRVVEETRQEAALAIRFQNDSGRLGRYHLYSSHGFNARFGWVFTEMPATAKQAARTALVAPGDDIFRVNDLSRTLVSMQVEAVRTPYASFYLFVPQRTPGRVRRLIPRN